MSGITWRGALDDDVVVVAWLKWKHRGETSPWIFKLCSVGQTQFVELDDDSCIWIDRRLPEGESVCRDVVELGGLLGLDGVLEVIDRVARGNLDRERIGGRFAVDNTVKGVNGRRGHAEV